MTILVTGAAGFVGLNLLDHLLQRGRDVIGLDRLDLPARARDTFARYSGRLTMLGGSILSAADRARALTIAPITAVIHCAVITAGAAREQREPEAIVAINVQAAVAMLRDAHRRGAARFIYPSSGAVYGHAARGATALDVETLVPAPANLYGHTKLAAERLLAQVAQTQGIGYAAARLGTVYGPWEYATGVRDTLSPMLQAVLLARAGQPALVDTPFRVDYVHAADIAAGLVALADAATIPRSVYNLGSGRGSNIDEFCAALTTQVPSFTWRRAQANEAPNVTTHMLFDRAPMTIDAIRADIGYAPRHDLVTSAATAMQW